MTLAPIHHDLGTDTSWDSVRVYQHTRCAQNISRKCKELRKLITIDEQQFEKVMHLWVNKIVTISGLRRPFTRGVTYLKNLIDNFLNATLARCIRMNSIIFLFKRSNRRQELYSRCNVNGPPSRGTNRYSDTENDEKIVSMTNKFKLIDFERIQCNDSNWTIEKKLVLILPACCRRVSTDMWQFP